MWIRCFPNGYFAEDIAYPTEAVYGLGCDPFNEKSVLRLLEFKKRSVDKGLILIAASWEQIKNLSAPVDKKLLAKALATWPGPVTWLFPAAKTVPPWIHGKYKTVALRITAHPLAKALCATYGGPIVSTSANLEGDKATTTYTATKKQFAQKIDFIVPGEVGGLPKPTIICDVLSGEIIR